MNDAWKLERRDRERRSRSKGCGLYGAQVLFTALTQRLPSVLPALPHVSAIDSAPRTTKRSRPDGDAASEVAAASADAYNFANDVEGTSYEVDLTDSWHV